MRGGGVAGEGGGVAGVANNNYSSSHNSVVSFFCHIW